MAPVMRYLVPLLLALPLLAACSGSDPSVVTVLTADSSAGGRAVDADAFRAKIDEVCEGCKVEVHDAGGDVAKQRAQFEAALDAGVGAVVLEPVDPETAEELVVLAEDVPVVAAGQLVPGADWFVGLEEPVGDEVADDDLAAARALVAGKSKEFVHVPSAAIASDAATVVVHAMTRTPLEGSVDFEGVPSWLHEPQKVTRANLTTVLVGPGLVDLADVCEGQEKSCEKLGLL